MDPASGLAEARIAPPGRGAAARWARRLSALLPGLATVLVLLGILELASRHGVLDARWFPPVTEIFAELARQAGTATFRTATLDTVQSWATGLGTALLLAIPLGIVIGSSARIYDVVKLVIEFVRPVPSVALIPLAVVMWGTGEETKFFLITFAAFWPLLFQAIYGVQDVDPVALDTARSFGVGKVARWCLVTLPSTLPYIATGARIASSIALLLAVGTELIVGAPGLGREIGLAQSGGATVRMYAYIVTTGLLGMVLNSILGRGERALLSWHPSHRAVPT